MNDCLVRAISADGTVKATAVYTRNLTLSETWNYTITERPSASGESLSATIEQQVTAGDDTYQVAMLNLTDGAALMTKGMLSDLNQMPHMSRTPARKTLRNTRRTLILRTWNMQSIR